VQPAFLIAAGYKWLLCPYGVSLLYVGEEWRDSRPLEETWLARRGAENFSDLTKYATSYLPGARRFDGGEKCTTHLPAAIAALEQIGSWTVERIALSLREINKQIADFLEALDFQLPGIDLRCPHMIGCLLPPAYRGDFVGALRAQNIFISQRGNAVRFAPHLHIDGDDLAHLFESIEDVIRQGRRLGQPAP
jgi:selenocysteine lyase/cysteine desulfurase